MQHKIKAITLGLGFGLTVVFTLFFALRSRDPAPPAPSDNPSVADFARTDRTAHAATHALPVPATPTAIAPLASLPGEAIATPSAAPVQPAPAPTALTSLSAVDQRGILEQIRAAQLHFTPHDGNGARGAGYIAPNPNNGYGIQIDARGMTAKAWAADRDSKAPWTWSLDFQGLNGKPVETRERLSLLRGPGVEEWFHNTPQGLEHGMTLESRNSAAGTRNAAGERVLAFTLATDLTPSVVEEGRSIHFHDRSSTTHAGGEPLLRYEDLMVTDSLGKALPARMEVAAAGSGQFTLNWIIADAGATYPVTIDPKLVALRQTLSDPALTGVSTLNESVAAFGDTVLLGNPSFGTNAPNSGTAIVFRRNADGILVKEKQLGVPALAAGDQFGFSVALSADFAVVGAPATLNPAKAGTVFVFGRNAGGANNWGLVKTLVPVGGNPDEAVFGSVVSLSGETLAVGAPGHSNRGRVFVFERNLGGGNNWGQRRELAPSTRDPDPLVLDQFGISIALDGDLLVVGAPLDGLSNAKEGVAYVFERNLGGANAWGERHKDSEGQDDEQARWVAASGSLFAYSARSGGRLELRVFRRDTNALTGFLREARVTLPPELRDTAEFGEIAGFAMNESLIGMTIEIQGAGLYLFERSGPTNAPWQLIFQRATGRSVSINGGIVAAGRSIFERPRTAWTLMASATGSVTAGVPIEAGTSVAMDGDVMVIGAPRSLFALDGQNQPMGLAYVFHRNEGATEHDHAWGLKRTLLAQPRQASDEFGTSVAIRGDTIAVGAPRRAAFRVVGTPSGLITNTLREAGSVFLFQRHFLTEDSWTLDGELRNPVGAVPPDFARFGWSVALSDQFLAVGAPGSFSSEATDLRGAVHLFRSSVASPDWTFHRTIPHSAGRREEFGFAVALDGDHLVVGSPARERTDTADSTDPGMALVFQRDVGGENNWGLDQGLSPKDAAPVRGERFGSAVAIKLPRVMVGAPGSARAFIYDEGATGDGRGAWEEIRVLTAPENQTNSLFGASVALDGPTAMVGAPNFKNVGGAFIFAHEPINPRVWNLEASFTSPQSRQGARFGAAVAISRQDAVVGEPLSSLRSPNGGAGWIFRRQFKEFAQLVSQSASDTRDNDFFGFSVALDRDQMIVGAPFDDGAGADTGSAYLFDRVKVATASPVWRQFKKLTPSNGGTGDNFGVSVAIHNSTAVVGAFKHDTPGTSVGEDGAAYIFERNAGGADAWGQSKILEAGIRFGVSVAVHDFFVAVCSESFNRLEIYERQSGSVNWSSVKSIVMPANGSKVALHGETLVFTSETETVDRKTNAGAAYVFDRNLGGGGNWGLVSRIARGTEGARFGGSVDVWGPLIAVGARTEGTGTAAEHGAAYVYERRAGTNFTLLRRLVAPDLELNDRFGTSVSIDNDMIAVGAIKGNGVNANSGAVYVFERDRGGPNRWDLAQKVTSINTSAGDEFGATLDLSGRTLLVGARSFGSPAAGNPDRGRFFVFELIGSGYDSFLDRYFPDRASQDEATVFGDTADQDGDGIVTPLEALFGLDPTVADAHLAPVEAMFDRDTGQLSLIYREAAQLLGVAPQPEWSPDLVNWYLSGDGPSPWDTRNIVIETLGLEDGVRFRKAARLESLPGDRQRTHLFIRLGVRKQ